MPCGGWVLGLSFLLFLHSKQPLHSEGSQPASGQAVTVLLISQPLNLKGRSQGGIDEFVVLLEESVSYSSPCIMRQKHVMVVKASGQSPGGLIIIHPCGSIMKVLVITLIMT